MKKVSCDPAGHRQTCSLISSPMQQLLLPLTRDQAFSFLAVEVINHVILESFLIGPEPNGKIIRSSNLELQQNGLDPCSIWSRTSISGKPGTHKAST